MVFHRSRRFILRLDETADDDAELLRASAFLDLSRDGFTVFESRLSARGAEGLLRFMQSVELRIKRIQVRRSVLQGLQIVGRRGFLRRSDFELFALRVDLRAESSDFSLSVMESLLRVKKAAVAAFAPGERVSSWG